MNNKTIYFLGIGGIGMSALARFFAAKGCAVAGYDRTCSALTKSLQAEGIDVHYSDTPSLIPDKVDLAVLTPAIPSSSLELASLRERNVPVMKRAEVLGLLSHSHKCLAIAGTHGKTSTTALVSHILMSANVRLSAFIGGISRNINSNVIIGNEDDDVVVMEADEFDHSFLQLSPFISIVTSIDPDHLDIYGDYDHLVNSFNEFVDKTADDGVAILHGNLPVKTDRTTVTYGLKNAEVIASDVRINNGLTEFVLKLNTDAGKVGRLGRLSSFDGCEFSMQLYGNHNVENALAAIIMCAVLELDEDTVRKAVSTFKGVQRRFDIRVRNGRHVYVDDYAHHPNEIKAALSTARKVFEGKELTVVFQPHLFTRTRDFLDGFAESLSLADRVILLDIYPAREQPIEGVSSSALLEKINCKEKMLCQKSCLLQKIKEINPELIVTMGAGDIDRLVPDIEKMLNDEAD
ncbi:MAG: UDP-N-acetylmuramate--L-alanine ligase [Candidatus Limimorpha sp.]